MEITKTSTKPKVQEHDHHDDHHEQSFITNIYLVKITK